MVDGPVRSVSLGCGTHCHKVHRSPLGLGGFRQQFCQWPQATISNARTHQCCFRERETVTFGPSVRARAQRECPNNCRPELEALAGQICSPPPPGSSFAHLFHVTSFLWRTWSWFPTASCRPLLSRERPLNSPFPLSFSPALVSSITRMPWSSATTTTPGCAPRGASGCHSWTRRLAWLRATATSGWRNGTGGQVGCGWKPLGGTLRFS